MSNNESLKSAKAQRRKRLIAAKQTYLRRLAEAEEECAKEYSILLNTLHDEIKEDHETFAHTRTSWAEFKDQTHQNYWKKSEVNFSRYHDRRFAALEELKRSVLEARAAFDINKTTKIVGFEAYEDIVFSTPYNTTLKSSCKTP